MDEHRPIESKRELENLRQRYQEHRRSVRHLLQTAPDSKIARQYETTLGELQRAIDQLDRVDRQPQAGAGAEEFDPNETREIPASRRPAEEPTPAATAPGRPFDEEELSSARTWDDPVVKDESVKRDESKRDSKSIRYWIIGLLIAIVIAGIIIAWPFVDSPEVDQQPVESEVVTEPVVEEVEPPQPLIAEPSAYDYGIIRKGTRSLHRFTITNRTEQPLPISVGRSDCRCLWYDYPSEVPAGGSVELAITVDGARADAGVLTETVEVSSEAIDGSLAEIDITAEVRER
ncbi:MAG: DUF1573 domain-containing protein [Thermoanaerobaculia bacterium]|nr:DUF1573 domain-containing protein [Thermoanaerobaculia bacterium]